MKSKHSAIIMSLAGGMLLAFLGSCAPGVRSIDCAERPAVMLKFSGRPIYNNAIFTDGFTFVAEPPDRNAHDTTSPEFEYLASDITRAFGTALVLWTSGLFQARTDLEPELRSRIEAMLRCSTSYCLLTPPQVYRVNCRRNANFVVRLYLPGGRRFPDRDTAVVARAQVRGRTVLINAVDHSYQWDLAMNELRKENKNNLITVMAHELGHSFGLQHVTSRPSIMNPDSLTLRPTREDALAFAFILARPIRGGAAGEFRPLRCEGLRLPEGAVPNPVELQ